MRLAMLLPFVLGAGAVSAAAPAPPSFPAEAELVTVDALVLGSDGRPVSGLTRDDFVVKEDGRPQRITSFEQVEVLAPALASPETEPSESRSRVATNVSAPRTRRTFAIVFDDLHIGDLNLEQVKKAALAFVERETRSGDRVLLFTASDSRYWTSDGGASATALRTALEQVRSHRRLLEPGALRISPVEAYRIAATGEHAVADRVRRRRAILSGECVWTGAKCECNEIARRRAAAGGISGRYSASAESTGASGDGCIEPPGGSSPEEAYAFVRRDLDEALRALRGVTAALAQERGRKAVVLVSEGFILDPSVTGLKDVREEAARANVSFYFLDARGLAVGPEAFSAAGSTAALPPQDMSAMRFDWQRESAGPEALARETGGLVLQTNDFLGGLAKVADEARVTYLLGYEPTNARRDGRYRKLHVEVRRAGLHVRARTGYFAAKGTEKRAADASPIDRALGGLFDADGIPLRLRAYVMGPAPVRSPVPTTGVEVLFAGELRLDALKAEARQGRLVAEPKLKLISSSRSSETHHAEWSLEIALADPLPGSADDLWHPFVTRMALLPGDHRARLAVQSRDRVGSVTVDFVVPAASEERLSTPILSDRLVAGTEERRVLPIARRTFQASRTLHCWIELFSPDAVETAQPQVTASFAARAADGREWAASPPVAMTVESGRWTRLLSLPLQDAPPGEQELLVRVRDGVSGATFEALEPFRVEPSR